MIGLPIGQGRRTLAQGDILPAGEYAAVRDDARAQLRSVKKNRRLEVGPFAAFYFENYDTLWMQVHEMLRVEKGGEEQVADELAAYGPLVPDGRELVATLMFEIADRERRNRELGVLGGVEDSIRLRVGSETIPGEPERDQVRSTPGGRASSVHFLHFRFAPAQIAAFGALGNEVLLEICHKHYRHLAALSVEVRAELAGDFDAPAESRR